MSHTTELTVSARVSARFLLERRDVVLHPLSGLEVFAARVYVSKMFDIIVIDGYTLADREDVTIVLEGIDAMIDLAPEVVTVPAG